MAEAPTSIVIRTPNWLGDLLMCTAFVRTVLERFPNAPVDLIVRQGFEVLPLPRRGEILPFDRSSVSAGRFGAQLRAREYSHFFILPPSFSSAWMAWRSGVPHRIGYRGEMRGWLLHPGLRHEHPARSQHLVREYLGLLAPWGVAPDPGMSSGLDLPEGWDDEFRPPHLPERYVVLAPGAEYGPAKQWPLEHYRALAAALAERGWPVVVAGLAKDRAPAEVILSGLKHGQNLCGDTDLRGLTALVAGARLLVSNDSGAMHLGAALGRPQLALFGSTNPTWTAPLNPKAEVVYRNEVCSPCYARECPLGHLRCLTELRPEPVAERALALLGEP